MSALLLTACGESNAGKQPLAGQPAGGQASGGAASGSAGALAGGAPSTGGVSAGGVVTEPTPGTPPSAPTHLRLGDRARPMNVEGTPLFGWLPQDGPNELQSAYQITLSRSRDQAMIWDSGKVMSSAQSYIAYAGPALDTQTSYSWTVRTWDSGDQASPWAELAAFDTGLADPDWEASWIRRSSSEPDDYTLARRELAIGSSPVTRARLYFAACHQAEVYLDGTLVDRGPSFAYPGEGYYQATDITAQVTAGKPLAVGALYHWYGSGQGRPAGERGLLLRLVVEHADGTVQTLVTDASWRVKRASAWQTATPKRSGDSGDYVERIDARNATPGWSTPGFDDSSWSAPEVVGPHPSGVFTRLFAREARVTSTLAAPVSVQVLPDGAVVADFGKVLAARPRIHFSQGKAGRALSILTGYRLLADGHVSTEKTATQGVDMSFGYTQAGGVEDFVPFTHLGWRYLQVAAPGETLTADALQASVEHTDAPLEEAASFESSDATLNEVFAMLGRSALYSAAYQFVDTPSREKGQFLGDSVNISFALMAGYGERDLTQQALREFARSQARYWPDGRLNAVYPNGDGKRDIPDFTEMYATWALRYFAETGDLDLLETLHPVLVNVADYVWSHRDAGSGLITNLSGGSGDYLYGIVDWPIAGRFDYDMTTAARTTVNVLGVDVQRAVAQSAKALGRPAEESSKYEARATELTQAINAKLRRADGVYVDGLLANGTPSQHASQHASAYAVAFGVAPAPDYRALGDYVASLGLQQGPMTAHWLLKALGDADLGDQVVARLTDRSGPGWANVLERGGTFTWESWTLQESESESHGWGSQALVDYVETLLGVRITSPGAATLDIVLPRTSLASAAGTVPTERGPVRVNWKRDMAGALSVALELPVNVQARVSLPLSAGATHSATGEGMPTLIGVEGERAFYAIGSGQSELVAEP